MSWLCNSRIEVVGAEDILIPADLLARELVFSIRYQARNLGGEAATRGDEAFGVFSQEILVDARMVIEAFELRGGSDLEQVLVTGHILRQQQQMIRAAVEARVAIGHAAASEVTFHADNGFDAGVGAGAVEIQNAKHNAVIGDGEGGHIKLAGALDEGLYSALTIEQGELAMDVEMDKFACHAVGVDTGFKWRRTDVL